MQAAPGVPALADVLVIVSACKLFPLVLMLTGFRVRSYSQAQGVITPDTPAQQVAACSMPLMCQWLPQDGLGYTFSRITRHALRVLRILHAQTTGACDALCKRPCGSAAIAVRRAAACCQPA